MGLKRIMKKYQNDNLKIKTTLNYANQNSNISKREVSSFYGIFFSLTLYNQLNDTQIWALSAKLL